MASYTLPEPPQPMGNSSPIKPIQPKVVMVSSHDAHTVRVTLKRAMTDSMNTRPRCAHKVPNVTIKC